MTRPVDRERSVGELEGDHRSAEVWRGFPELGREVCLIASKRARRRPR
ncbi:hypothetical protein ACFXI0_38100 [Kitasatospora indigofera]